VRSSQDDKRAKSIQKASTACQAHANCYVLKPTDLERSVKFVQHFRTSAGKLIDEYMITGITPSSGSFLMADSVSKPLKRGMVISSRIG
jgi:hypothetical protein